jgi:hypothetical protein
MLIFQAAKDFECEFFLKTCPAALRACGGPLVSPPRVESFEISRNRANITVHSS